MRIEKVVYHDKVVFTRVFDDNGNMVAEVRGVHSLKSMEKKYGKESEQCRKTK